MFDKKSIKRKKKKLKEVYLESEMKRILTEVDKQPSVSLVEFVDYIQKFKKY
jgi:hypothetical protein